MSDRYRTRWERRQAKWQARQAKWEARAARHEAYRVGYEARRAARRARWEARRTRDRGQQAPNRSTMPTMGAFGGLFLLLGLFFAFLYPGVGALASLVLCLIPGAAMLMPWLLWALNRSRRLTDWGEPRAAGSGQETPQAVEVQRDDPAPVRQVEPLAAPRAAPAHTQSVEPPPAARTSNLDPSYYRERAAGYRRRIQSIIRSRRPGPLADVMSSVVAYLQQWEERVGQLADRLTTFERDTIIQRDIKEVPTNIVRLRGQIEAESDAGIHAQMVRTLAGYESQQTVLDTLSRLMRRTRLLLDDTLVTMGTIYSQIRVIDAMDIDNAQTQRIAAELDEQVGRLNDLLAVLGEVSLNAHRPAEFADQPKRIQMPRSGAAGV